MEGTNLYLIGQYLEDLQTLLINGQVEEVINSLEATYLDFKGEDTLEEVITRTEGNFGNFSKVRLLAEGK